MNRGEAARISSQDKSRGTLWFGTSLGQFLIDELKDFPGRRLAALRGFIVVMTIVLVSETLLVAPLAIALSMNFNPYLNAGQSLILGVRQFGYTIVTALVSVGALIFAGDAPWLLLPMSFIIMALALFHARLIAWPTASMQHRYCIAPAPPEKISTALCGIYRSSVSSRSAPGRWCN